MSSDDVHPLALGGRILLGGYLETTCVLECVKGSTARFTVDGLDDAKATGRAVAYVDLLGRLEGNVHRMGEGILALAIDAPEGKRERLARQSEFLSQLPAAHRRELRLHHRIQAANPEVVVWLADGSRASGSVIDFSRSGAAVLSDAALARDDSVTVGKTRARVARTFDGGFAARFARLIPFEVFDGRHVL